MDLDPPAGEIGLAATASKQVAAVPIEVARRLHDEPLGPNLPVTQVDTRVVVPGRPGLGRLVGSKSISVAIVATTTAGA
jgi:hypothetical protein